MTTPHGWEKSMFGLFWSTRRWAVTAAILSSVATLGCQTSSVNSRRSARADNSTNEVVMAARRERDAKARRGRNAALAGLKRLRNENVPKAYGLTALHDSRDADAKSAGSRLSQHGGTRPLSGPSAADVQTVAHQEPVTILNRNDGLPPYEEVMPPLPSDGELTVGGSQTAAGNQTVAGNQIADVSLAEVLATAGAENWAVQLASERIREADAKHQAARAMWLPSLNAGIGYTKHDGQIQDTRGGVLDVSRNSLFVGGGAVTANAPTAAGSGGPARMFVDLSLADAIFEPRKTQHRLEASYAGHYVTFNDTLLEASVAYFDLVRAHQLTALAKENLKLAQELLRLTTAFKASGKGTQADVSRVEVEVERRKQDVAQAEMMIPIASAELARILRIDLSSVSSGAVIAVRDTQLLPVEFISSEAPLNELIAQAVSSRPEVSEAYSNMEANWQGVQAEKFRPWIPNLHMGLSSGGFGGGSGGYLGNFAGRADVDLLAVWQVRNLGLGTRAARREADSRYRQTHLEHHRVRDLVAAQVAKAHARVTGQKNRMDIAVNRVKKATAAYNSSQTRIRAFQGLPLETLQDVRAVIESKNEVLNATFDFNRAQLMLLRAVGRTASE